MGKSNSPHSRRSGVHRSSKASLSRSPRRRRSPMDSPMASPEASPIGSPEASPMHSPEASPMHSPGSDPRSPIPESPPRSPIRSPSIISRDYDIITPGPILSPSPSSRYGRDHGRKEKVKLKHKMTKMYEPMISKMNEPKIQKGKEKEVKMKSGPTTRSKRAGLLLPVGRFHRQMKEEVPRNVRVSPLAGVYLGAVVEYLISEVLELAERQAEACGRTRIVPRNIFLAVKQDADLSKFIRGTISEGGVLPTHHEIAMPVPTPAYTPHRTPYRE